jgi:predicted membrane protein
MSDSNINADSWREDPPRNPDEQRAKQKARVSHGGVYACQNGSHSHVAMGIIVLLLGILFLLENLGFFYVGNIWKFWPVILIALGIAKVFDARGLRNTLWGIGLAAAGLILLAKSLGYISWSLWQLWPVLLIFWGISMLLAGLGRQRTQTESDPFVADASKTSANVLKENVVFGGIHRKVEAQDFQGGKITATFGGIEIDLRGASTTREWIIIEAHAIFGGVELKVPDTWDVTVSGASMLGGYVDNTHPVPALEGTTRPRLIINGSAVFGGVTVRN